MEEKGQGHLLSPPRVSTTGDEGTGSTVLPKGVWQERQRGQTDPFLRSVYGQGLSSRGPAHTQKDIPCWYLPDEVPVYGHTSASRLQQSGMHGSHFMAGTWRSDLRWIRHTAEWLRASVGLPKGVPSDHCVLSTHLDNRRCGLRPVQGCPDVPQPDHTAYPVHLSDQRWCHRWSHHRDLQTRSILKGDDRNRWWRKFNTL